MAVEVNWQDPPPTATRPGRRAGGKYGEVAAQLRANPGKAVLIDGFPSPEQARNFAGQVERGKRKGFGALDDAGKETATAGGFEAYTEPNSTKVWVQYVGPSLADDSD